MRPVKGWPILIFLALVAVAVGLSVPAAAALGGLVDLGAVQGVFLALLWLLLFYAALILLYRLFLWRWPLPEGEIPEGSREERIYHVYLLFYLLFFYPPLRSRLLPVPLLRLVYQALGARMGPDSYSAGLLMDPPLIELGARTLVGEDAIVFAHAIEGRRLSHARVRIGSGVTIGARAILMSGVEVGDGAL
ncbi:MAG: acyltransferase, partial [Gammaproteobacteria bacterium]